MHKLIAGSASLTLAASIALGGLMLSAQSASAAEVAQSAFGTTPTEQSPTLRTSTATGEFYTAGGVIYDPQGKEFIPQGINVGVEGSVDWGGMPQTYTGTIPGHLSSVQEWNFNTLRVNLLVTTNMSYSQTSKYGYASMMAYTDRVVNEYTSKKIVLILEPHDATGGNPDAVTGGKDPAKDALIKSQFERWYVDTAAKYKDNPYVWVGGPNEPALKDDAWVNHHDRVISLIRGAGGRAPIPIGVPVWGQDLGPNDSKYSHDPSMMKVLQDKSYPNGSGGTFTGGLITEQHNYGGKCDSPKYPNADMISRYADRVRTVSGTPLMFGEFGYDVTKNKPIDAPDPKDIWGGTAWTTWQCSFDPEMRASNATMDHAKAIGVGLLMWHGTHGGDGRNVKANTRPFWNGGSGVGLSQQGTHLWNLYHEPTSALVTNPGLDGSLSYTLTANDLLGEPSNTMSAGIKRIDVFLDDASAPMASFGGNGEPTTKEATAKTISGPAAVNTTTKIAPKTLSAGVHTMKTLTYDTAGNVVVASSSFTIVDPKVSVSGTITGTNSMPLSGVSVTAAGPDGSTFTTTSKPDGTYVFEELPGLTTGQSYTIAVNPPAGYQPTEAKNTEADLVDDGSTSVLDFALTPVPAPPVDPVPTPTPTPDPTPTPTPTPTPEPDPGTPTTPPVITPDPTPTPTAPITKPKPKPAPVKTKVVTFYVQDDTWRLRTNAQVATTNKVLKDGKFSYREDVRWNTRTGKIISAPLWAKGVSTWKLTKLSVRVPVNASPAQVLTAQKKAAASHAKITPGKAVTARKGKTYRSVWVVPSNSWSIKTTTWRQGPKTAPQILVGTSQR